MAKIVNSIGLVKREYFPLSHNISYAHLNHFPTPQEDNTFQNIAQVLSDVISFIMHTLGINAPRKRSGRAEGRTDIPAFRFTYLYSLYYYETSSRTDYSTAI
jgi:hypothetical protein